MRSWYALADMIGLFVLMITMVTIFNRIDIYEQEYNAQRLSKSVEYSTHAAFDKSLAQRNSDIDYNEFRTVQIDTRNTLETFEDMMCFNYNLSRTDTSRAAIEDSIRGGMLMTEDGYYLLSLQSNANEITDDDYQLVDGKKVLTEEGKRKQQYIDSLSDSGKQDAYGWKKLMWLPKQPYIGKYNNNNGGNITVSYNLNGKTIRYINDNDHQYKKTDDGDDIIRPFLPRGEKFGVAQRTAISQTVTNALAWSVNNNDEIRGEAEFGSYVPSDQTISGINRIAAPSIMFVVQGGGYSGEVAHENVALTGIRTIKAVNVIGYRKNGKKMYAYEWQGVSDDPSCSGVEKKFKRVEEAAEEGYAPDYEHIFNPIDYDNPTTDSNNDN